MINKKMKIYVGILLLLILLFALSYIYGMPNKDKIMQNSKYQQVDVFCEWVFVNTSFSALQKSNKAISILDERIFELEQSQNDQKDLTRWDKSIKLSEKIISKMKGEQKQEQLDKLVRKIILGLSTIAPNERDKENLAPSIKVLEEAITQLPEEKKQQIVNDHKKNLESFTQSSVITTIVSNYQKPDDGSEDSDGDDGGETPDGEENEPVLFTPISMIDFGQDIKPKIEQQISASGYNGNVLYKHVNVIKDKGFAVAHVIFDDNFGGAYLFINSQQGLTMTKVYDDEGWTGLKNDTNLNNEDFEWLLKNTPEDPTEGQLIYR